MSQAQPPDAAEQALCAMCTNAGALRCTACRDIKYCSEQCQKRDWPIHKIICKTLKHFADDQRPDLEHYRAIRFPQIGEQPHFFWLKYTTPHGAFVDNGIVGMETIPALGKLLVATDTVYNGNTIHVFRSLILYRLMETRFNIVGKFREADCGEDAPVPINEVNKSLLKIDRELQETWYGEIITYEYQLNNERPCDIGALSFRHAVDALRMRHDDTQRERAKIVQGPSVQGLRFANNSDIQHSHCEVVKTVSLSAAQCAAQSEMKTPICDRIGIPIVVHRLPLSLTGRDRLSTSNEPGWMGLTCVLHYLNPLTSFVDQRHGIGSAVAVRKDGRPLSHAHMIAIVEYSKHLYQQHQAHTGSEIWTPADLEVCTKEHFMEWWQNWKLLKNHDTDYPSPYEV